MHLSFPQDWGDQLDVRYRLAETLSGLKGKKILDIGCGKGYLLALPDASNEKHGVDISSESIAEARSRNPRAHLQPANMLNLPFVDGSFDVVYLANTLPHADFSMVGERTADQRKAIAEAVRVLKKGGLFLLTTPNNARYGSVKTTYAELSALLTPHFGICISGWNPFPSWPYFLPNRLLKRIPGWFFLLDVLCEKRLAVKRSKFFYVQVMKP